MPGGTVQLLNREDIRRLAVIKGAQSIVPIPLYDTIDVANGNTATSLSFFSNTRGAQGLQVTNLEQPNQLISGKEFVVEKIMLIPSVVTLAAGTLQDFVTLTHAKAAFNFKINGVEYAQGEVQQLIGGSLFGFGTPAAFNQYASARWVEPFKLDPAVLIPTQTSFSLEFVYATAPNPAATVTLKAILMGKLIRLTSS